MNVEALSAMPNGPRSTTNHLCCRQCADACRERERACQQLLAVAQH